MKTNPQFALVLGLLCGMLVSVVGSVLLAQFHSIKDVPGQLFDTAVLFLGVAGGFSLTMLLFIAYIELTK